MTAPRLSEVTARVVAWHNRHPLARRIDPTQVHSIGEVRLPFASALPWGGAGASARPAAAPEDPGAAPPTSLAEVLAQRSARHAPPPAGTSSGIDGLEVQSLLPDADLDLLEPPTAHPAAGMDQAPRGAEPFPDDSEDDDGEAALVIPLLDGDDPVPDADADAAPPAEAPAPDAAADAAPAPPQPAHDPVHDTAQEPTHAPTQQPAEAPTAASLHATGADAPADIYPPPHGNVPASALARAVERRAAARGAVAANPAELQPALEPAPASRWRRLLARLRLALTGRQPGMPPLRAAFSQEFIWPLRPGQVARWARRHGRPQPVAPADWPHRHIDADRARLAGLRLKGHAHDLPLHVLTAAIGVGDRRIRVLVGADGSILGPRAFSRPRVGSLAVLLALGLVGAGWTLRPLHAPAGADEAAVLAALTASAASAAAAASAPVPVASAPDDAASATALALAASAADDAASSAHANPAEAAASAPADGHAETATAAAEAADAASQPRADIRPTLSGEQKYAAKVEAARLRGEPPPPPPPEAIAGPVYAVVGPVSRQRDAAAGSLALMQAAAARLSGPVPEHGELVQNQGQWRAAWWPFASLVDAERARVLLAGKGLKAEVVEF